MRFACAVAWNAPSPTVATLAAAFVPVSNCRRSFVTRKALRDSDYTFLQNALHAVSFRTSCGDVLRSPKSRVMSSGRRCKPPWSTQPLKVPPGTSWGNYSPLDHRTLNKCPSLFCACIPLLACHVLQPFVTVELGMPQRGITCHGLFALCGQNLFPRGFFICFRKYRAHNYFDVKEHCEHHLYIDVLPQVCLMFSFC